MKRTLRALRYLAFPSILGGALGLVYFAVRSEIDRDLIVVAAPVIAGLIVAGLEQVIAFEPSWSVNRGDVRTDVVHLVVSMGIVPIAYEASLAIGLQAIGAWASSAFGLALWPAHWPLWGQVLLALVIGELGYYWAHRLGHSHLWRFHATHHSAERLYWLNVARFHPVDAMLQLVGHVGPLALLGATPEAMAVVIATTSVHGLLQHSNADVRLGPLNWIFSSAQLHRWHHAKDAGHRNFGQVLALYDVIFGTRFLPEERPPADIGVDGDFPKSYLHQLASPFSSKLFPIEPAP